MEAGWGAPTHAMTIRFDLTGLAPPRTEAIDGSSRRNGGAVEAAAPLLLRFPHPPPRVQWPPPSALEAPPPPALAAPPPLTFTISASSAGPSLAAGGLVRRFARPVLDRLGIVGEAVVDPDRCQRADDDENDQYTIRDGKSMCWSVLFRNDTGRKHPRSILGDFGHAERLSAWIHLIAGVAFAVYACVRPSVITTEHTAAETWTTLAVATTSFCFASSTIYHITSPSERAAYFTRQLDFIGIYAAIAVGSVADFAIATRSFQNVSVLSVIDGPIAAVIVCAFFLARRGMLPSADTWSSYLGGCTIQFGLFRRMHLDKAHTGTRQATSFLLVVSYFVSTPSLFNTLGTKNAMVILALEIACFAVIVLGMTLDNAFSYPDVRLSQGKGPRFLVCKPCGCVGSGHALWHVLTVVAAVKGAVGRELALGWQ